VGFARLVELGVSLRRADEQGLDGLEKSDVDDVYKELQGYAKVLHEELRLRIGLRRSRISLVRRFAGRCMAFDGGRLRALADSNPAQAEAVLSLEFARYLFDAGLSPLLNPTIHGLEPDVVYPDPSAFFYVEAKQYKERSPKPVLKKAYAQVWSTWGRIRATYPCDEAFLLVFRRCGPYVELPAVIHHQGLRLYSVLADISEEAGSRERNLTVRITEEELLPVEADAEEPSS
jgi:hypothetical protein